MADTGEALEAARRIVAWHEQPKPEWKEGQAQTFTVVHMGLDDLTVARALLASAKELGEGEKTRYSFHRCRVCGCFWRRWADGTWSLADGRQKSCNRCDNSLEFLALLQPTPPTAIEVIEREEDFLGWDEFERPKPVAVVVANEQEAPDAGKARDHIEHAHQGRDEVVEMCAKRLEIKRQVYWDLMSDGRYPTPEIARAKEDVLRQAIEDIRSLKHAEHAPKSPASQGRDEVVEMCAKVCDAFVIARRKDLEDPTVDYTYVQGESHAADDLAKALRSLKHEVPDAGEG